EPLNCPDGMTRKSIALYYYSSSSGDGVRDHNTLFQPRPGEELPEPDVDNQPRRQRAKDAARLFLPPILLSLRGEVRRRRRPAGSAKAGRTPDGHIPEA